MDLFAEETDTDNSNVKPLSFEQYQKLIAQLGRRSKDAILPVQIAYFTGLRLGRTASGRASRRPELTWMRSMLICIFITSFGHSRFGMYRAALCTALPELLPAVPRNSCVHPLSVAL